jgi:hypothetical protein
MGKATLKRKNLTSFLLVVYYQSEMFRSISARDPNENNQKLGLLAALLRAGAWPLADTLLNRLPRTYCVAQVRYSCPKRIE